ncbi:hypothetical protein [Brevibacterium salitolerans]|uniref:Ribosome maturation factor RimP n=1 Tax=Brevibacterium salitolerans TaxID=1403566 RepID=A0ABN2X296_9MICO
MAHEADVIREKITRPLEGIGLLVEDVRAHAAGRHRKVTVTVDLDAESSEPVGFDLVEQATRLVSELLDEVVIWKDSPYDLEVTSPGAERELREVRHYRRSLGRRVQVAHGAGTAEGTLESVDAEAGEIAVAETAGTVRIALADVTHAKVVVALR